MLYCQIQNVNREKSYSKNFFKNLKKAIDSYSSHIYFLG
jgi:hypothetical protein